MRTAIILIAAALVLCPPALAQDSLDGRAYDPAIDPDIDLFIGSWENAVPVNTHGTITERAILSPGKGDPVKPARKAEVLHYTTGFSRGTLEAGSVTTPTTLKDTQEIFYIRSGMGTIRTANTTADLNEGVFVLAPAGCEFTIANAGDETMEMYIIREPVVPGLRPNPDILVKDEKLLPFREQGQVTGHWSHNGKSIFGVPDGLAVIESVSLITINEMCIAHPHSHGEGIEEVWTCVDGNLLEMIGKQIRWMMPGTGFVVPPTGFTPHSHINPSNEPVKILIFARWTDHSPRP